MVKQRTRTKEGKHQVLCGGYVSWDLRRKDDYGYPLRRTKEVHVWMPAEGDYSDCGYWTNKLVSALKKTAEKHGKKNVEVSECWQC
jgi:hypothetical protein